jgi:hypothetical protein
MLPPPMRSRPVAIVLAVLAALASAGIAAGCGEEEAETEVVEGEPIELGELGYNVGLTRFLNPDDNEDAEYLVGLPEPEPGTSYLGVFLTIENESEEPLLSADSYIVRDTLENEFATVPSESPYALEVGAEVPADGELPLPNTTAATGPNHGALLVFAVEDGVSENRPLKLAVEAAAGEGEVILDI